MSLKGTIKGNPALFRAAVPALRLRLGARFLWAETRKVLRWLVTSREFTNYTYFLAEHNVRELAHFVAHVLDADLGLINQYFDELESDSALRQHVADRTATSPYRFTADEQARFGQRIAWYAMIRAQRPAVVVETGLDKGLGTCVLAAALLRNQKEGAPGKVYAVDINPTAGWLVAPQYDEVVEFVFGNSHEALIKIEEPIDMFVYDSDTSNRHEEGEYAVIGGRLRKGAIVLSLTTHHNTALMDFAEARGEKYFSWREHPKAHFYPGGGLGAVRLSRGL